MKIIKIDAIWCNSCLVMRSVWEKIEIENPWIEVESYDLDIDTESIKQYEVSARKLPLFIFLDKDGKEFLRLNGEMEKKKLVEIIAEHRNK